MELSVTHKRGQGQKTFYSNEDYKKIIIWSFLRDHCIKTKKIPNFIGNVKSERFRQMEESVLRRAKERIKLCQYS